MTLNKLQTHEMAWAQSVGRATARTYFEFYHPELTSDELERLLSVVDERPITPKQTASHYDPNRNKCVAAIWLLGGSFRQLATAYAVTPETMLRARDKGLAGVQVDRIKQPPIELTRVLQYRDFCTQMTERQPGLLAALDALMIAKLLENLPTRDADTSSNEYDAHDSPGNVDRTKPTIESKTESEPVTITAKNFDWSIVEGENK